MTPIPSPANHSTTHSSAPAPPRGLQREQRARVRHLKVAAARRRRRRTRIVVWGSAVFTAMALFVLVAFHVLAMQHSFALDQLADRRRTEELRYERLRAEVATLSAPPAIVGAARQIGMQPPESIDWISAPLAAPTGNATDQTSSTLADIHGFAKQSLDP